MCWNEWVVTMEGGGGQNVVEETICIILIVYCPWKIVKISKTQGLIICSHYQSIMNKDLKTSL